jgi:hypothetical protein
MQIARLGAETEMQKEKEKTKREVQLKKMDVKGAKELKAITEGGTMGAVTEAAKAPLQLVGQVIGTVGSSAVQAVGGVGTSVVQGASEVLTKNPAAAAVPALTMAGPGTAIAVAASDSGLRQSLGNMMKAVGDYVRPPNPRNPSMVADVVPAPPPGLALEDQSGTRTPTKALPPPAEQRGPRTKTTPTRKQQSVAKGAVTIYDRTELEKTLNQAAYEIDVLQRNAFEAERTFKMLTPQQRDAGQMEFMRPIDF